MKKTLTILMLTLSAFAFSQNKYGARELTPEAIEYVKTIKKFDASSCRYYMRGDMPSSVDNTISKYFSPILNQEGNSCGSASNTHYIYSYELNRMLDRDGKSWANVISYLDVWNHLNQGIGYGVFSYQVYDFINSNGAVSAADHPSLSHTEWVNGFEIYRRSMPYRVEEYYTLEADKPEDFQAMKAYLADGGLMEFEANTSYQTELVYEGPSELGYKYMVPLYTSEGMHAMTIAGYDDAVWYDYDGDGEQDDFEMGAFLCVNSWGENWGDNGRFYTPYYAFTTLKQAMGDNEVLEGEGGTGNGGLKLSYIVKPKVVEPQLVMKLLMEHTSRNDMSFAVAAEGKAPQAIEFMNQQGGDYGLCNSDEYKTIMEFGIDVSGFVNPGEDGYVFTVNNENIKEKGVGRLLHCTLLDYSKDAEHPQEYWAEFDNSEFSGTTKVEAKINCKPIEYAPGQNTVLKYSIQEGFRLYITCFSKEVSYSIIELLDANGAPVQTVYEGDMPAGSFSQTIDLGALPKGNYTIKVVTENDVLYKSFKK